MKYRRDIDGLRTLAIVPVVLFHAGIRGFGGGFVGVDIFFVISGYLITRTIWEEVSTNSFSIVSFYDRRVRRIFPALFATLFVVLAVAYATKPASELQEIGSSAASAAVFVSNIFFWAKSGYFDVASDQKPLLHMWTLSVEEQFYIFFPLFLLAIHRYRLRTGLLVWLVLLFSLVASVVGVRVHPTATFYWLPTRAWELMMGAVLAVGAVPSIRGLGAAQFLSALGLACVIWSVVVLDRNTPFPGAAALIPCLGAGLIIYAGVGGHRTVIARVLGTTPFVFVGLISYSLYLWHWPILVFASSVPETRFGFDLVLPSLALATLMAYLSWRFVEKPFRRRPNPYSHQVRRRLFSSAALCVVFVVVVGEGFARTGGLPRRDRHYGAIEATMELSRRAAASVRRGTCKATDPRVTAFCYAVGDTAASNTIVVWGDSFADAWRTAFDSVGRRLGYRVEIISHPGCPPLLNVTRPEMGARSDACHDAQRAGRVISYLGTLKPVHVFLLARWSAYERGDWLNGRLLREPGFLADAQSPTTSATVSRAVVARNLRLTLAGLAKIAAVTVFRATPNFDKTGSQMSFDNDPDAIMSLEQHRAWQSYFDAVLDSAARESDVGIFDPAIRLCADGFCRWRDARTGLFYFFDANHVTWAASRLFIEDIVTLVERPTGSREAARYMTRDASEAR